MNWFFKQISPDTVFATSITIFIFLVGYFFNRIYDNHQKKKELNELKEFLKHYLLGLEKPIRDKISNLNELSYEIKKELHPKSFALSSISFLRLEIFNEIPKKDIYQIASRQKLKPEELANYLSQLFISCSCFPNIEEITQKNFEYFNRNHFDYIRDINEIATSIIKRIDEYKTENINKGLKPSQDIFIKELDQIIALNTNKKRIGGVIELDMPNIFQPMIEVSSKYITDERALEIKHMLNDLNGVYNNYLNLKKTYSTSFARSAKELDENIDLLKNSVSNLFD